MFSAIGIGAARRDDGVIGVKVGIYDDRITPPKFVREQLFLGASVTAIRTDIQAELQRMKNNENDATLNAAVVGVTLASV